MGYKDTDSHGRGRAPRMTRQNTGITTPLGGVGTARKNGMLETLNTYRVHWLVEC